ncbi:MAG: ABC transporter permease [Flammeovirgaceae bacterium]|nr:ABC transporter permease [Flammeovirgaceae bacterium]MBR06921.1 ABC transporter permease [Rickettsiales bacterium]HCX24060.1 ABC transporter permease [Cytophagales bacterium]|tara:strand:- start:5638 stop:6960 length:1323 start_codon:yes stop_codon:yes gene_type:complete
MNNIGLIIAREYLSRVRKKSFIIMTLLAPILFGGFIFIVGWTASKGSDTKNIQVVDESGMFAEIFVDSDKDKFDYSDSPLDDAKAKVLTGEYDGLLYIPKLDVDDPQGVMYYAPNNPSIGMVSGLSNKIEGEIENIKLRRSGLDKAVLESLKADVDINTINLTESGGEKESSSIGATAVGYVAAFLIYMFIFVYGAMCMRGVVEEKTSRIIEVVIASVKPFQLMMGKVIGIASVGLTQFVLWIILTITISTVAGAAFMDTKAQLDQQQKNQMEAMEIPQQDLPQNDPDIIEKLTGAVESINLPMVVVSFLFYFLAGYLLYGALFAAIGSAVDSDADAQQFMFPVTIPLIFAIVMLSAVLNDPNGSLAFWLSMVPFTSPVIMMMRVPFGVPVWELALSMVLMVGGFLFTIWLASRIYRIGILMHGTKVNYKTLGKWIMTKN